MSPSVCGCVPTESYVGFLVFVCRLVVLNCLFLFFSSFFFLLLSLQVPEHVKWFSNAKNFGCVEGVVSLSDLSIEAIALIHRYVVPCWW
jgi:hypothetical protein